MNNSIVTSSPDEAKKRLLAWCFDTRPQSADWATVLAHPEQLDLSQLTAEMERMGPERDAESIDDLLHVWRLQQRIRLAARHAKGLPLATQFKCAQCGTHATDPVLAICLHCADLAQQATSYGSRGSCKFLRPAYDPAAKCWALLSYRSFLTSSERAPILLYAATGYADYAEADQALLPLSNYARLVQRASVEYQDVFSTFDFLELVAAKLPMTPAQWNEFCRRQILRHHATYDPKSITRLLAECINKIERADDAAPRTGSE